MADLRLEDIGGFFVALGLLAVVIIACLLLYVFWPQIVMAIRGRFVTPARHTDRPSVVSRFEGERGLPTDPRREPAHMSSQRPVPEHRIIAVPGTGTNSPVPPVPAKSDLTYDEAVRRAAAIKVNGKWWMSGKKLYSIVGGNHARFLEIVSEVRGEPAPDDVPAAPPAISPIAGRPYNPASFHSDNPELQYQEP
jgi:hypothetical protein